jgi:hypothetical protein
MCDRCESDGVRTQHPISHLTHLATSTAASKSPSSTKLTISPSSSLNRTETLPVDDRAASWGNLDDKAVRNVACESVGRMDIPRVVSPTCTWESVSGARRRQGFRCHNGDAGISSVVRS